LLCACGFRTSPADPLQIPVPSLPSVSEEADQFYAAVQRADLVRMSGRYARPGQPAVDQAILPLCRSRQQDRPNHPTGSPQTQPQRRVTHLDNLDVLSVPDGESVVCGLGLGLHTVPWLC
jgi:hypothetical protein